MMLSLALMAGLDHNGNQLTWTIMRACSLEYGAIGRSLVQAYCNCIVHVTLCDMLTHVTKGVITGAEQLWYSRFWKFTYHNCEEQ